MYKLSCKYEKKSGQSGVAVVLICLLQERECAYHQKEESFVPFWRKKEFPLFWQAARTFLAAFYIWPWEEWI